MKNNKRKVSILTVCLLLTVLIAVGSTIAYIFTSTDPVKNTFTPVENKSEIEETFEGVVKTDVKVSNTGDVDSFVRAKVVITWQDKNGNVYPVSPVEDVDYTIVYADEIENTTTYWVEYGDFWYYTVPVKATESTTELIDEAKWIKACEDTNYSLHIEILSQAIQSTPAEAVQKSWGVTIAEGSVEKYTEPTT